MEGRRPLRVTVLGATGSIGASTLSVIERHPDRFRVHALTASRQVDRLAALCHRFRPAYAVVADPADEPRLRDALAGSGTIARSGRPALVEVAGSGEVDQVMAAIVGAAGLEPTIAAARSGKRVLLANKESLVMAGQVFLDACGHGRAEVLPIDSEHNAVFQCLPSGARAPGVRRIILTASGGPFRTWPAQRMATATPDEACAHPRWSMGRKISVDSATLMNKGLELIEAHYLFGMPDQGLEVVVHPQSIVHSLVEYEDGSVLAQLGNPDMRTPIAHAMAYPARVDSGVAPLSLAQIGRLEFETPDEGRFPCLRLARESLRAGGAAPCVLNAANEVAVERFLAGRLRFDRIAFVNEQVVAALGTGAAGASVAEVLSIDAGARRLAAERCDREGA